MSDHDHEQEMKHEQEKILQLEKNIGRTVTFLDDDGTRHYGKITGVSNSEHYTVMLEHKLPWPWYVRVEAVHFVEEIQTRIQTQIPNKI